VGGSSTPIYTWEIVGGVLPTGLSLDSVSGEISGTPTTKGSVNFVVQVTEATSNLSTTKYLSIDVTDLEITTVEADILNPISIGSPVAVGDIRMLATGGTAPLTWSVTDWDGLPADPIGVNGLYIDASGNILGTVPTGTQERRYFVEVTVTDSSIPPVSVSKKFNDNPTELNTGFRVTSLYLVGGTYPTITMDGETPWLLSMTYGGGPTTPGSFGGGYAPPPSFTPSYTWSLTAGSVPAGMSFDSATGLVSGVPSAHGYYSWTVRLLDNRTDIYVEENFAIQIIDPNLRGSGAGGSTFCFIATAAYGSYLDSDVISLRRFRDDYLLSSTIGRAIVGFYYRNSPPVADYIARHGALRFATRLVITPIAYAAKVPMPLFGMVFFAGAVALAARTRKKKA